MRRAATGRSDDAGGGDERATGTRNSEDRHNSGMTHTVTQKHTASGERTQAQRPPVRDGFAWTGEGATAGGDEDSSDFLQPRDSHTSTRLRHTLSSMLARVASQCETILSEAARRRPSCRVCRRRLACVSSFPLSARRWALPPLALLWPRLRFALLLCLHGATQTSALRPIAVLVHAHRAVLPLRRNPFRVHRPPPARRALLRPPPSPR